MRQNELAASLSLDGSSVVRLLDALEKSGLIERCEDAPTVGRRALRSLRADAGLSIRSSAYPTTFATSSSARSRTRIWRGRFDLLETVRDRLQSLAEARPETVERKRAAAR